MSFYNMVPGATGLRKVAARAAGMALVPSSADDVRQIDETIGLHRSSGAAKVGSADPFDAQLETAAWDGAVPDGLLRHEHFARQGEAAALFGEAAVRIDDAAARLASLEAALEAFIERPSPPPAPRTVLGSIASIIPFSKGEMRHG